MAIQPTTVGYRQCVFFDAADKEQACEPYKTRLNNGNEIYCPRCRHNKFYWMRRSATDLRAYGYRLRLRSARMSEWVGGKREEVVRVMTREMHVGRRRNG